ncbi:SCO family protein [Deinococcus sp. Marseille-Q6407]|uniref:SCO family protein n=1 Tax=Deinococcus sp. Marseille-Q6407 TaxID=2969223 RepID=UPI0021BFBF9A|nr:SCO family protein [Deinococcus sp. Marseille-Q6407]
MKWLTPALLLIAAVLAGLLFFRQAGAQPQYGTSLDEPKPLPSVALLDDRGQPANLNDSHGKLRLVFYGFVRCPDVCPATLSVLSRTYGGLRPQLKDKVLVQMVSVDPANDRPEVLRQYLDRFDPAFAGLTGDTAAIDRAAREMFVGVTRPPSLTDHSQHMNMGASHTDHASGASASQVATAEAASGAATDPADTGAAEAAMLHGDQVSVVDAQGNFVRVYGNQEILSGQLGEDLPALVTQYGPK